MTAPLTTRDALAEAVNRVGLEWSDEDGCIRVDDEEAAEFTADMVRAITLVAKDEALVERAARALYEAAGLPTAWALLGEGQATWKRLSATALAAALSTQSERAEVER